jgi:hypothetical protein
MSWIVEHKRILRAAVLVLLLLAMMGPWAFDLINVPAGYACSAPFIRLDDNFCGTPLSGLWLFRPLVAEFVSASAGVLSGAMLFREWARGILFALLQSLLLLPFLSTLLLVLRGDRRWLQVFNLVAWALAAGVGLLIGLYSFPRWYWGLWGIWLYFGLVAGVLVMEIVILFASRRSAPVDLSPGSP